MTPLVSVRDLSVRFVTREGTDDGTQDISLATKVLQVWQQLSRRRDRGSRL